MVGGQLMARCTAPTRGHRSASAAADCPACGSRYGRYGGYSSYGSSSYPSYSSSASSGGSSRSSGGSSSSVRPRWSRAGSSVSYTPTEVLALTPIRESFEARVALPDLRDVFLCHAWDDRQGLLRSYMTCSKLAVSRFGSARKMLPLARHCFAKSIKD